MTRVRFDPHFVEDERWERLGSDALVLHMAALSYAVRTLSDGVVSAARIRVLTPLVADPESVAQKLLNDGLWSRLEDGAVAVCTVRDNLRFADDRGDDQPSRAYVEGERKRANDRKEQWKSKHRRDTPAAERVPERVPNMSRNGSQSSALRPSAVQDPEGSLSCTALDGDRARRIRAHRPRWTRAGIERARVRLRDVFAASGDDAQGDADVLLEALAAREKDKIPDVGAFLDRHKNDDLAALPEVGTAVSAARIKRKLDRLPNGEDARRYARKVLGDKASDAVVDRDALQLITDEPDFHFTPPTFTLASTG